MRHERPGLLAVLVGIGVACSNSTGPYGSGGGGGGGGGGRSVSVGASAFNPANLSVTPGSVTWTWNSGGATHNVTFEDGSGSGDRTSGTHSQSFTTAATYRYRCTIHSTSFTSGMVGQVAVSSGGGGGGNPYP